MVSEIAKKAYNQMDFRICKVNDTLQMPASKPAVLNFDWDDEGNCVSDIKSSLSGCDGYIFINLYTEEDQNEFYITSTVYDVESNSRFDIRMDKESIRLFEKRDGIELESVDRFIQFIENNLSVSLSCAN